MYEGNFTEGRTYEIVHVDVGGFRKQTPALQQEAELPSGPAPGTLRLIDFHCVQQSASSDLLDEWGV